MGKVTFLGVEGSGKTVLTMALVNAFRKCGNDGVFLRPDSRAACRLLMEQDGRVKRLGGAGQPSNLNLLAWSVIQNGESVCQINVLDYSDEIYRLTFLNAERQPDTYSFREQTRVHEKEISEIRKCLRETDRVFLLFNPAERYDPGTDTRNTADAEQITEACLCSLYRLPYYPKITLVLTQIDRFYVRHKDNVDPGSFSADYLPLVHSHFPNLDTIVASAFDIQGHENGMTEILRTVFPEKMSATFYGLPIPALRIPSNKDWAAKERLLMSDQENGQKSGLRNGVQEMAGETDPDAEEFVKVFIGGESNLARLFVGILVVFIIIVIVAILRAV